MSFPPEFIARANLAFTLCQRGQFQEALEHAEALLPRAKSNTSLLNLAGVCARATGQFDKAKLMLQAAITSDPQYPNAHNNLGLVLLELGQLRDAENAFLQAILLQPNLVDAQINLGNLYQAMHLPDKAEKAYRGVLALAPANVTAVYNLGLLLSSLGQLEEAEALLRKAHELEPGQAETLNDLGNVLMDLLRFGAAESAYKKAISLRPDYADAYCNLGLLFLERKRHEAALNAFKRSLELEPGHPDAVVSTANLLCLGGHFSQAEEIYRVALLAKPEAASLHNNLGNLLIEVNRLEEAEAAFRMAAQLQPDYGHALGQAVYCARQRWNWSSATTDENIVIQALEHGISGIPSLMTLSLPETSPKHHRLAASLNSRQALTPYLASPALIEPSLHREHTRLRIGYLSADFNEHAVTHLLTGVLECHDRKQMEVHAYSTGPQSKDAFRKRIEQGCEYFLDIQQMDNIEAARQIANDEIDILIDLSGHTGHARPAITAQRPSPVIINWLGFPGTLGIPRLADYIIGDAILTPLEHAQNYSETLAWMPNTYQPNDSALSISDNKPARIEVGLPVDGIVFCSFNQPYKLTPQMFELWCKLLEAVPKSVLWLQKPSDESAISNLTNEASMHGIAAHRLVFAPILPMADHLARLQLADLALDTFPYGSGASGSTILRAGIPMITLIGDSYVSRMAASQLSALGMPELITTSMEQYFNLAKDLALDPTALSNLRTRITTNRTTSPLFDTIRFTQDLETLYRRIWQNHAKGIREPITAW